MTSLVLLVPRTATARVTVKYRAQHRTGRLPEHVLEVLRAHERTCDSGCRYRAPGVARSLVLSHRNTKNRYYIWSHVDAFKDARMFMKVTVHTKGSSTWFQLATPTTGEIEDLERHTKLKHEPLLDSVQVRVRVDAPIAGTGSLTHIDYAVEAQASGMLSVFDGMIRRSLQQNAEAFFENVDK